MEIIGKTIDFFEEKWGVRIALETLIFIGGAYVTLFLIFHPEINVDDIRLLFA